MVYDNVLCILQELEERGLQPPNRNAVRAGDGHHPDFIIAHDHLNVTLTAQVHAIACVDLTEE